MVQFALILNILVLVPVLLWMARGGERANRAYGPAEGAYKILFCIYTMIALASLVLLLKPSTYSTVMLFSLQIGYKIMSVFALGPRHPVALSNLAIAAVLSAAIYSIYWGAP